MSTIITIFSVITFILFGSILVYEGVEFYHMKKSNPSIPNKMYVAAYLSIILGIIEILLGFGQLYFFLSK